MSDFLAGINDNAETPAISTELFEISDAMAENALAEATQDVIKATDPPTSSSDETLVENHTEQLTTETVEIETPETPIVQPEIPVDEPAGIKELRNAYKAQKTQLTELQSKSLENDFLLDIGAFTSKIKDLSQSQYDSMVNTLATNSATSNPQGWMNFFKETNADLMAQTLTGDASMTASRLESELAILKDPGLDLTAWGIEKPTTQEKQIDTEKVEMQKRLQLIEDGQRQQAVNVLESELYGTIVDPVNELVKQAGLEAEASDSESDKAYKELANTIIGDYIAAQLERDPVIKGVTAKTKEFVNKLDKNAAMQVSRALQVYAENQASKVIELLTNKRAEQGLSKTQPKVVNPPPLAVNAVGAGASTPSAPAVIENPFEISLDQVLAAMG
jgi:hypothetical protein